MSFQTKIIILSFRQSFGNQGENQGLTFLSVPLRSRLHPGGARARGEARFAFSRRTAFPWTDTSWVSGLAYRQGKATASESSPLLACGD